MSNYCKYYRQQKYMSIDGGITWTPLEEYQKGRLIERNSDECGYVDPIYRTITSEPYCSGETGFDKYVDEYQQVSYNNGASWITTATTSILIEQYSQDCGYVPLTKWERITPTSDPDTYICEDCSYVRTKWIATYSDSHVESADCDSTSSITMNEITKTNLSSVQIGDCVTNIAYGAFQYCTSLTSIDIPSGVTSISDYAFYNCTSLSNITIPNSVTSIGDRAFRGCSGLTSITCLASVPPALGNYAFDSSSCTIYVPCESIDAYKAANGWSTYSTRIKCIAKWVATYSDSHVESADCDSNSSIVEKEIVLTDLKDVEIGLCVTNVGANSFRYCSSLSSVTFHNSITTIEGQSFEKCTSLLSVTIPDSVTSIGQYTFGYCSGLTSVTIPDSVTSIGQYAFYKCDSLPVENNIRYADNYLVAAADNSLSSYTFKAGTKWIGEYAFHSNQSITSMNIPNGVIYVGMMSFSYCYALRYVTIPDSVTTIMDYAFRYCTGLSQITIGSGITFIGSSAFENCKKLNRITIYATTPPELGYAALSQTNFCLIYVPAASVDAYKSAPSWGGTQSRIRGM